MKAVYIREFGGVENLGVRDVPDPPKPQGKQVLVRVSSAGLNRADILQRKGLYPPPPGYSPNIPGLEFAGEVADVGPDVGQWKTGDRVFGITAGEAQAEYLPAHETLLAPIPDKLDYDQAAAVPEVFVTAHDAIFTQCRLQPGEWLLIHAVGSGVGLAGLQLAKANGARVAGTSRTQNKLDRCKEFAIDLPLLIREPKFAEKLKQATAGGANVVLDLVGGSYFPESLESLAVKGRLVIVGLTAGRKSQFDLGMALSKRAQIIGTMLRGRSTEEKAAAIQKFVDEVVPLFKSGAVKPNLDRVFQVEEVHEAHRYLESNESFGKVVLRF